MAVWSFREELSQASKLRRSYYELLRDELDQFLLRYALCDSFSNFFERKQPYPYVEKRELKPRARIPAIEYEAQNVFLVIFVEDAIPANHKKVQENRVRGGAPLPRRRPNRHHHELPPRYHPLHHPKTTPRRPRTHHPSPANNPTSAQRHPNNATRRQTPTLRQQPTPPDTNPTPNNATKGRTTTLSPANNPR